MFFYCFECHYFYLQEEYKIFYSDKKYSHNKKQKRTDESFLNVDACYNVKVHIASILRKSKLNRIFTLLAASLLFQQDPCSFFWPSCNFFPSIPFVFRMIKMWKEKLPPSETTQTQTVFSFVRDLQNITLLLYFINNIDFTNCILIFRWSFRI